MQIALFIYFISPMSLLSLFCGWGKWRHHEVKSKFTNLVHPLHPPDLARIYLLQCGSSFSQPQPTVHLSLSFLLPYTHSVHSSICPTALQRDVRTRLYVHCVRPAQQAQLLIQSPWQTLMGGSPVKPWTTLGRTEELKSICESPVLPLGHLSQASSCWVSPFSWVFMDLWKGKPWGLGWVVQVHCGWCSWEPGM